MEGLEAAEYAALRSAIAARTHLRAALMLAGIAAWAGALVAVLALLPVPVAAAIPLLVLVATFEVIRPLHFGAERIGRYLQVYYEEASARAGATRPTWETTAYAFGPSAPGAAGHPLFVPVFVLAASLNLLAVFLPGPVPLEWGTLLVPHAAFVAWLARADRAMRVQRAHDLERYRALERAD
jgi:hypothetical protein